MRREKGISATGLSRAAGRVPGWEMRLRFGLLLPLALAVALVLAPAPGAHAASVIELTAAELVTGSSVVLVGTASGQFTYREDDNVWTTTTLEVEEVLKGSAPAVYTVRQYGGIIGDIGYAASGIVPLRVGQRYLLMLEDEPSITPVRGLYQGLFHVRGAELTDALGKPVYWRGENVPLQRGEAAAALGARPSPETVLSLRSRILAMQGREAGAQAPGDRLGQAAANDVEALPPSYFDGIRIGDGDFTIIECGSGSGNPLKGWENKAYALQSLASIANQGADMQWLDALNAAIADWNAVSPNFQIGLTVTNSTTEGANDGKNTIGFFPTLRGGAPWGSSTLGVAFSAFFVQSCFLFESDIYLNSTKPWSSSGSPAGFDFQSVAGHEIGHSFGLDHPNDLTNAAIMLTGSLTQGTTMRVQQSDRNGVNFLYGGATPPPPPPPGLPDLVVSSLQAATTATIGGTITLSEAIVQNTGPVAAGPFFLGLFFSTDSVITTTDIFVGACDFASGLGAGATGNCPGNAQVPQNIAPGTYFLGIMADLLDEVTESNENNNTRIADTGQVTLTAPPGPDLVVTSLRAGTAATTGGALPVTELVVRNQGNQPVSGTFRVGVYFSTNNVITTGTDTFSGFSCTFSQGLAAGASLGCTGIITVPNMAGGNYFLGAIVDDQNQIAEALEGNNTRVADTGQVAVTSNAPDLIVTSLRAGTAASVGGSLAVTELTVRNNGNTASGAFRTGVYFSTNNIITTGADTFSGFSCSFPQGLPAGASQTCNGMLTVPLVLNPATYFLGAIADDLGQVAEANEGNNTRVADTGTVVVSGSGGGNLPAIFSGGVVNGASFVGPAVSAGAIVSIFGVRMSTGFFGILQPVALPLPTSLGGTSVRMNGLLAPLFAVANVNGNEQINAQVPQQLAGQNSVSVVVESNGLSSPPVQVNLLPAHPGVFTVDGVNGAILHGGNNSLVTAGNPATGGEVVVVYTTGLGEVTNTPATGTAALGDPLSMTTAAPVVTVGGINAAVEFSGLAPGFVGLYQINIVIPPNAPSGDLDLIVTIGGQTSSVVKIAVQ